MRYNEPTLPWMHGVTYGTGPHAGMDDFNDAFLAEFDDEPSSMDEHHLQALLAQLADPRSSRRELAASRLAFTHDLRVFDALVRLSFMTRMTVWRKLR